MKTRFKRITVLALSLILGLTLFVGCGSDASNNSTDDSTVGVTEWEIPVLSAVTGPIAFVGKPASWVAEYAVEMINENGGINGINVSAKIFDTKFDTAEAVSAMSEVVDDSLVILGPMDAPGGEACGQLAYDAKVANIAAYSFSSLRETYSPYAISYMTDSEDGDWLSAQKWIALNPDIKSIVIFVTPSDASASATARLLQEKLPTIGVTVEKVVEVETGTLDCGPAAVQAINEGVDGYISVLRADENAKVVSELRTRGVDEGRRISCGFSSFSDNYINVVDASALDGTYIWNKLDPNYAGEDWQKLIVAYKADFDGALPTVSPIPDYYNALLAIKQCYEELNITGKASKFEEEKAAIAEWFYNSPVIHGIQGDFQWVKGQKVAPIYFFQFEGNKPVAIN